jgi:transposase
MSDPLQERQVRRRLAVLRHAEEVTGNVAQTCRYYGISRQCYYTWLRRFETEGPEGLRDRSQRPHHSPNATQAEIVEKIVHLRRTYHFGPAKIVMYLARYHEVTISSSGVWRILKRLDLNRLPTSQRYQRRDRRWKRYEKAQPGHRLQIDVKFIEALPTPQPAIDASPHSSPPTAANPMPDTTRLAARGRRRYYQFTAIDDCTRLRVLKA